MGKGVTVTDFEGKVGPGEIVRITKNLYDVKVNWSHICSGGAQRIETSWPFYPTQTNDYGLKVDFKEFEESQIKTEKEMKNICTKVIPSAAPLIQEMVEKRGLTWHGREQSGFWGLGDFPHGIGFAFGGDSSPSSFPMKVQEVSLGEFIAALEKIPEKQKEVEFNEIFGLTVKISKNQIVAGCQTLDAAKIEQVKAAVDKVRNPSVRVSLPDFEMSIDSSGLYAAGHKISFEQFDKIFESYEKIN